ncbi:hypothetical protein O0I10_006431 [Lichtheimia ornata]|uniref:Rab-GAP TBC domain-containing protein n=1 Tax=Lichtheimia ornata TaxID=688661 RepID=A0AAD7V212_9FUNG|nr:uncharacterized protein O0I10_006431 [Lichtheimia ornata]KAJ8657903.1 hypothetical protein O0I10_006431 [Lichtheimia ornata]
MTLTVKKEVTQQMALIDNLIQHRQPAANNKHMTQLFSEHCVRSAMRWFIDMENIANTLRLFDLFLSYDHPWMPFYFAAALAMAQHTPRDIISTQELETLINKAIELEHGHNTVVDHSRIDISRVLYDPTLMVVASMALLAMVPSGMSTLSDLSSKVFSSFFI